MVEWKTIGDISSNVFAGGTPSTKHEEYYDGDIPWIRSGEIDFNVIISAERNITKAGYDNSSAKLIRKGSVVMAMTGATVAKSAIVDFETTANQSVCAIETDESIVNYKFVFYSLVKDYFKIKSSAQGALTSLNLAMIRQIQIPIPSLSEQTRIVGILDTFTASIENLKQQIAERRKQYEYYRDQLLDLEGKEGVEMKKLGDIAKVLRGKRLTKNLLNEDAPYPVFHGGLEPLGRYDHYNREANTVMVINVGASAGTVGFCDSQFWSSDGCFCISHSEILNDKYLYYYLETKTHYIQSQVRHAGIPTLDNPVVEKIQIPILSLHEQSRIVSILDTFEASIANLEAQLKEREKQYEYSRNKLLTFK